MSLIQELYNSFNKNKNKRAFCVNGVDISYAEFQKYVNGTRELIEKIIHSSNNPVGIVCYENIETYAAIFATWFSGNYFVPLNPKHPSRRIQSIIENVGIRNVLTSKKDEAEFIGAKEKLHFINNTRIKSAKEKEPKNARDEQLLYVLTTSGSTGIPKYVPINLGNMEAYCHGFMDMFPEMNSDDCFLQVYDLTVDASFTSYIIPLLAGACVYTLPDGPFKFLTIAKVLSDKKISWVKITPSVLSFLSPHKSQLNFKHLKCVILGGEALPVSLLKNWLPLFPDTVVTNHYGPTETTVGVTSYIIKDRQNVRSKNGVVSIGKPFKTVESIIVNEDGTEIRSGDNGELCISGNQVMPGYLSGDDSSFINLKVNNRIKRYYRTGDIVQKDKNGFIYYIGRTDDQVKIEGHRINLVEIENRARDVLPGYNVVMVAHEKLPGVKRLYLFVEGSDIDKQKIKSGLIEKLPPKMIPEDIYTIEKIPLTTGGKTDKKRLVKDFLVNLTDR